MNKYRRIEVNAYRRRVTVVSGEWRPDVGFDIQPAETDNGVALSDSEECDPVEPDSPEGQLILVEAVRTLEQRLTPETRATISLGPNTGTPNGSSRKRFCSNPQSFYQFICQKVFLLFSKGEMKNAHFN